MRKGKVLTDDIRAEINRLAETMSKPSAGKIARRLNLKADTVHWYMLTRGMIAKKTPRYSNKPYVRHGKTVNPYSPEHDAMLTALRIQGNTFTKIAAALTERFGIPRNAHSVQVRTIFLSAVDDESEAA